MTSSKWEYSGLAADTYDLWFGNEPFWDQRFFFERIKANSGAALELACGTGRLLVPFLRDGLDIEGVDASPRMLDICRHKAAATGVKPVLYEQLMQELAVPRRFRTIYIPADSFQIVVDPAEAMQALVRSRDHLTAGGELIITLGQIPKEVDDESDRLARNVKRDDGSIARVYSMTRTIPSERIQEMRIRFEIVTNDVVTDSLTWPTARLRWYEPDEFVSILRGAGFGSVEMRAGYGGGSEPDDHLIFFARV
jgi:ubiquinone/menaquinone biosynthesis C-methylase UbiE